MWKERSLSCQVDVILLNMCITFHSKMGDKWICTWHSVALLSVLFQVELVLCSVSLLSASHRHGHLQKGFQMHALLKLLLSSICTLCSINWCGVFPPSVYSLHVHYSNILHILHPQFFSSFLTCCHFISPSLLHSHWKLTIIPGINLYAYTVQPVGCVLLMSLVCNTVSIPLLLTLKASFHQMGLTSHK